MAEKVQGYQCQACDATMIAEAVDVEQHLYECSSCGRTFVSDSNRCECNKFAAKSAELGCSECEMGELLETELWWTADGSLHESEQAADDHEKTKPQREAALKESKERSDRSHQEYMAQRYAETLGLVKRLGPVLSVLEQLQREGRLQEVDDGFGLERLINAFSSASEAYEHGDEETAVERLRGIGLTVQFEVRTFFMLCEAVAERAAK